MGNVVAVIPARYASTRLPGKPLLRESGKFLIQHVVEAARACPSIDRVIVATDDERIRAAVRSFGGEALMTRADHPNGTSRIAEVAEGLDAEFVLNIQGDEPEIPPEALEKLIETTRGSPMATLATPFSDAREAELPNRVKVVLDREGNALYFSRSRIPSGNAAPLLHLGLYGFQRRFLLRFAKLPPTPLEQAERLEQLRALEHGFRIRVGLVTWRSFGGIDTPEDYRAFLNRLGVRGT